MEINPVSEIFWGRAEVRAGTSLFRFEKGSVYQNLLHDLKYRGNKRAGYYLGSLLGQEIQRSFLSDCDLLVPVPLHRRRQNRRGYNQSEIIARGISEITGIPIANRLIARKRNIRSQTSMNREERFNNMASTFTLCSKDLDLHDKRVLIIDDIITTGATLEACSQVLLRRFNCQVYIATVSYA